MNDVDALIAQHEEAAVQFALDAQATFQIPSRLTLEMRANTHRLTAYHLRKLSSRVAELEARPAPSASDDVARDAYRFRWLSDNAHNSLHISHNDHASNYCTAKEWIEDYCPCDFDDETADQKEKMSIENSIWRIQIYPDTPVGFVVFNRATLAQAIDAAMLAASTQEKP